jgi:hypothetical protein
MLLKLCLDCRRPIPESVGRRNEGKRSGARCPACLARWEARDNARRQERQRVSGRTTARWGRLKKEAKERAGYCCEACGRAEIPEPRGWLSVHLRPDFGGDHRGATLHDTVVLCTRCHGVVDGARSHQPKPIVEAGSWIR